MGIPDIFLPTAGNVRTGSKHKKVDVTLDANENHLLPQLQSFLILLIFDFFEPINFLKYAHH